MSASRVPKNILATQAQHAVPPGKRPGPTARRGEATLGAVGNHRARMGVERVLALQAAAGNRATAGLVQARREQAGSEDGARVHEAARLGIAGTSEALPHLETIQRSFGRHDVSGVAAHTGAQATAGAQAMGALAFAMGDHVAFAGNASLHTAAHEAAHVVQQRAGLQLAGGVGQVGDRHERHADAVAGLVVQGRSAERLLDSYAGAQRGVRGEVQATPSRALIQRGLGASKASPVGRVAAVLHTQQYAKPKVGWLVNQTVSPFASLFGDLGAGAIGQHYKDRAAALDENVTKRRLILFAIQETAWWQQQKGFPGWLGSQMSKQMRAAILIAAARRSGLLPPKDDEKA